MALADIVAAEQAAATPTEPTETITPPTDTATEQVSTPPVEPSETPPADPPSPPPADPEAPEIDPFIARASEKTGMDLSDLKDEDSFLQSYAATRSKLSERDELAKLAQGILASPHLDKIQAILQGNDPAPPPTPPADPPPQTTGPPTDPEALAAWQRQRAEQLLQSDRLMEFVSDPEGFLKKVIDPAIGEVRQSTEALARAREEEMQAARVEAVLKPVAKELFTGEQGDWSNVTPLGAKVSELYASEPEFVQADPVKWFQKCVDFAKSQLPQPKPTKQPNPAATRQPAVGAPPADTRDLWQVLNDAAADGKNRSLAEWQQLVAAHSAEV